MTRAKRLLALAAFALIGIATIPSARAVTTKTWTTASYKDFDDGTPEGSTITSLGEVVPGIDYTRTEVETDTLWTAVRGADGTVYAGAVSDGKLFAINGDKVKELASFEDETPWIGSLALAGDTLYVGTLGSGSIHAVDVKTGKHKLLAKLDGGDHVWAMVVDGKTLYAATGPNGKLFAVDTATGKAKVLWDSGESHLLSMIRSGDGALWIGTADDGILFRYDTKKNEARAIADFAGSEIKAIAEVPGAVVIAENEFDQSKGGPPTPAVQKGPKGTAATPPAAGSGPGSDTDTSDDRSGERKGKGALFRVEPDGRTEQLHALADGYFQSLVSLSDGTVYAAAGSQGRVYIVKPDRTVLTAFDVAERQVNAIMTTGKGDGVAFVTGDSAAVYTSDGPAKDPTYTSKVFDAGFPARWGNLRWRGTGVTVQTRTGNTAKPDVGWSAWEKVGAGAKGTGEMTTAHVTSPTGRYLQYRVAFDTKTPGAVLRQTDVYYLPQNQRARVTDINVDWSDAPKKPITTQTGAIKPRNPTLKVKWTVDNADGDDLEYKLEMRPEGQTEWIPVNLGDTPYTKTDFDWNTEVLADGWYRVRVTATDDKSNPPDVATTDSYVSTPFLVDNTKPQITDLAVKAPYASARAVDNSSKIDEIAYSVDGGDWIMAYPKDGIFDDLSEPFTIKLPDGLKPGTHTLAIRVADEAGNVGATSTDVKITK